MAGMRLKRCVLRGFGAIVSVGAALVANSAFSQVLPPGPPQTSSFIPYGILEAQHDSNVYRTQNSSTAFAISGDPTLGEFRAAGL